MRKKDNESHSHLEDVFCSSLLERYANDTFQRPKNRLSKCGFNYAMYQFFYFVLATIVSAINILLLNGKLEKNSLSLFYLCQPLEKYLKEHFIIFHHNPKNSNN